jgi:MerR family transcriptional regulator/heat shock protein HspR
MQKNREANVPVYTIGVAARLCEVHPQTLRTYERLGLVVPARVCNKNRMYSEQDILRIKRIQRLTQDLGVNLAGVEVILRLLDELEEVRNDLEQQLREYVDMVERRVNAMSTHSNVPIPRDEGLLPVPKFVFRKKFEI